MPARFTLENWQHMDSAAQVRLCHNMTVTSMKLAETSPFNVAGAFFHLAEGWSQLATEITRSSVEPPNRAPELVAPV
jgi:hypothetical protein